ncbi:MAG TPA: FAD-binding oxidoreductase [Chloroflexi bacterium]|nr:FAD-binding oxidoreductase [Chloroflexota bacterium]
MSAELGCGQKRVDACDVVVVGAGLVGAAAATRLADEGLDVAVLEARSVAGGATGRSAGMVLSGLTCYYNQAVEAYGRRKAQAVWSQTIEGRDRLLEAAERLDVPVERTGSVAWAVEEAEAEDLEESAALLLEDGFAVQFEGGDSLGRGFYAALRYPDDVAVDAAALTQAMLFEDDIAVHPGTEVYHLEREGSGVRVWAKGRTVLCDAVLLAVNGYAVLFDPYFTDKVVPTPCRVLTTNPLDGVVLQQPGCANYGYEFCRQFPDRRFLLGTWRFTSAPEHGGKLGDHVGEDGLVHFVNSHFPDVEIQDSRRGSGLMGFTPDGLPLIGQLPDTPGVYFAVGFGGRGLAWAFVVAERLAALVLGEEHDG